MNEYCRFETEDGKCRLLSDKEVTQYCVSGPCFLRIPKRPLVVPKEIIDSVLGDDE